MRHWKIAGTFLLRISAVIVTLGTALYGVIFAGEIDLKRDPKTHHYVFHHELWWFCLLSLVAIALTCWKETQAERIKDDHLERKQYLIAYRKAVVKSINVIQDVGGYTSLDQFEAIQYDILDDVCKLAKDNAKSKSAITVNANLMIALPQNAPRFAYALSHVRFMEGVNWDSMKYSHLLQVVQWASDDHDLADQDVSFPVHRQNNKLLFGAPYSFGRDTWSFVNDTHMEKRVQALLSGNAEGVRESVVNYFKGTDAARSIVSVPLHHGDNHEKVGVLTLQASCPDVFGKTNLRTKRDEVDRELLDDLEPFFVALGASLAAARRLLLAEELP